MRRMVEEVTCDHCRRRIVAQPGPSERSPGDRVYLAAGETAGETVDVCKSCYERGLRIVTVVEGQPPIPAVPGPADGRADG